MVKIDVGKVKKLRQEKGLSQENLAYLAGLTASTVASIETGRKGNPRVMTLVALARALGVDFQALLCEVKEMSAVTLGKKKRRSKG